MFSGTAQLQMDAGEADRRSEGLPGKVDPPLLLRLFLLLLVLLQVLGLCPIYLRKPLHLSC